MNHQLKELIKQLSIKLNVHISSQLRKCIFLKNAVAIHYQTLLALHKSFVKQKSSLRYLFIHETQLSLNNYQRVRNLYRLKTALGAATTSRAQESLRQVPANFPPRNFNWQSQYSRQSSRKIFIKALSAVYNASLSLSFS